MNSLIWGLSPSSPHCLPKVTQRSFLILSHQKDDKASCLTYSRTGVLNTDVTSAVPASRAPLVPLPLDPGQVVRMVLLILVLTDMGS